MNKQELNLYCHTDGAASAIWAIVQKIIHLQVSVDCFMPCSSTSRVTFRPFLHRIAYRYITSLKYRRLIAH